MQSADIDPADRQRLQAAVAVASEADMERLYEDAQRLARAKGGGVARQTKLGSYSGQA